MDFINVAREKKDSFQVKKPGKHLFFLFNYSGNLTVDIQCPQTEVWIYGLYLGRKSNDFTLHTIQHHGVGKSVSDLFIKGIFFDDSKFVYEGLIKIDKNAQQSNAYQKNQNILMSDDVFVDSRPYLEIEANDVRCTHGSTTGKLPLEQLQFLNMRGISSYFAEKLLLEGFVGDIFDKIEQLGCKKELVSSKIECLQVLEEIFNDKNHKSRLNS